MSEERDALRSAVRGLLSGYPARDGYDSGLWRRLGKEIGVAGLGVPEEYGGAGGTPLDAFAALEEIGRTLIPAPMLGTVLGTQALLASGNVDVCERLLPRISSGEIVVAVTWDDTVVDATPAGLMLVVRDDMLHVVDVSAVTLEPVAGLDLTRSRHRVTDLPEPSGELVGPAPAARLRDLACVALSAEQVGTASRALELTVEYAKNRVQFGRPIGGFQVLQHRMAEVHVRVEAARSASETAAAAFVAGAPDAARLAAVAKVWCSETLREAAATMVQIHGGLAITWEHDAHLYLRRAWDTAELFGSPRSHLDRIAATLLPVVTAPAPGPGSSPTPVRPA
jgi:alkylation response protein AidB-like acyl-CoA dehydrogenase